MNHHALNRDDGSYLPQEYLSTLLANDVIPHEVYKKPRCDFRSSLMKTLDWSVETLGRECNSTGLSRPIRLGFLFRLGSLMSSSEVI